MSFVREKRLLLGVLALLAPLPLPFNEVVGWPAMAAYTLAVLLFLKRAAADPPAWLPPWAMNVLGLVYLPVFGVDLFVVNAGRLVTPVLHLLLFTLAVKLFAFLRERDKWQCALVVFFLFIAAMGTSVHPTIVLYLVAFLGLALWMLARFAVFHVLSGFGRDDPSLARVPLKGFLGVTAVISMLLAVPLFALLPRVSSPYIMGRGVGTGTQIEAAGFTDEVTLDSIGQVRTSRDVALRILVEGVEGVEGEAPPEDAEVRLKASTFERYEEGRWRRSSSRGELPRVDGGVRFRLAGGTPVRWLQVWLQPLRARSLPLPVETLVVEPRVRDLQVDSGGAVSFGYNPLEVRNYRVGVADLPILIGSPPDQPGGAPSLDLSGVTPRIAALARQVMGEGSAAERAVKLESHLIRDYTYTTRLDRGGDNPIENFLFNSKSGHCEYFASSMVLMLRSQGIAARLVTGYLGGEQNPFEGYFLVRQSNAHAWVEAYLPGQGWQIFDPTPPGGRPAAAKEGLGLFMQQAWDFMLFRWDRYVLTFGIGDQLQIWNRLRQAWSGLMRLFDGGPEEAAPAPTPQGTGVTTVAGAPADTAPTSPWIAAAAMLAIGLAAYAVYRIRRKPLSATLAYRRLQRRLGRSGLTFSPAAAPLTVRREAADRFPDAAVGLGEVIGLYLRESFGGEAISEGERLRLKEALKAVERGMTGRTAGAS